MPGTSSNGFDPDEFAKLLARFDTGNPSEAEAMNAGSLMRRSLVANGLRLVDAVYRPDVMQALDAQLQPVREKESPELKAAYLQNAELAEMIVDLREQLAGAASMAPGFSQAGPLDPAHAYLGGLLAFAGVMCGAALLFAGVWHVAVAVLRWFESL